MNFPFLAPRRDGGSQTTATDLFINLAITGKDTHFDGFYKEIKYSEGVRGKWSIHDAKTTCEKLTAMCKGDISIVPVLVTTLGSICQKISENNVSNDDVQWYFEKSRQLLNQSGAANQKSIENCYIGYTDMIHGLSRLVETHLDSSQQLEFLPVLKTAISVLSTKPGRLTAAHKPLLVLCVQNRLYHMVDSYVCQCLVECSPGLNALDYLYYFYYAGLVHVALKRFEQALDHFAMCQIVPGDTCSMLQVDAHKKYILVSLIVNGKIAALPEFVGHRLQKTHNKCCRPYFDLEEAFSDSSTHLGKVVERHYETYEKDNNVGLVRQVMKAQEIARVRRLRNVYASCSVEVAAHQAEIENPATAKKIILHLIKEGELSAQISADNVITFTKKQNKSERRYMDYAQKIAEVMDLTKKTEEMFYALRTSEKYIKQTSISLANERKDLAEDVSLMT
jgi:COP9 signalosome complex subunit 3